MSIIEFVFYNKNWPIMFNNAAIEIEKSILLCALQGNCNYWNGSC
jgi:hypothetical protein